MRRISDENLEFLNDCTAEELDPLLDAILGKDRSGRISSELEKSKDYQKYNPDHTRYTSEIADEISKFGGNSIANLWRKGRDKIADEILKFSGNSIAANSVRNLQCCKTVVSY